MPFIGPVIVEKIIGGDLWRVYKTFHFDAGAAGIVEVDEGRISDLASIPHLIPLAMATNTEAGGLVHDKLYQTGEVSRKTADAILYLALRDSGVSIERATVIYEAVRIGGVVAWKEHRRKDK